MQPNESAIQSIVKNENWKHIDDYFRAEAAKLLTLDGIDAMSDRVGVEVYGRQMAAKQIEDILAALSNYGTAEAAEQALKRTMR